MGQGSRHDFLILTFLHLIAQPPRFLHSLILSFSFFCEIGYFCLPFQAILPSPLFDDFNIFRSWPCRFHPPRLITAPLLRPPPENSCVKAHFYESELVDFFAFLIVRPIIRTKTSESPMNQGILSHVVPWSFFSQWSLPSS